MSKSGHRSKSGNRRGRSQGKRPSPFAAAAANGVDYNGATKTGCSSGKWGWAPDNRAGAKTLSKALRKSGGKGVREYVCPECGRWHVGHLPFEARRGHRSAREVYGLE